MMPSRAFKNDIEIRKRQIDTLKIFNDNVTEIVPNEEYTVGFKCGGKRKAQIQVLLPLEFPNEKPRLLVSPTLNHQWVDCNGVITNAPGLVNFTIHSDLGRVVQAVIREFEKSRPPNLFNSNEINGTATQVQTSYIPTIEELGALSIDELTKLDSDDIYLDDFADENQTVQNLNSELSCLMTQIETIANDNLGKRDRLEQLNEEVKNLASEFTKIGSNYDNLTNKYQRKAEEFAPQHIKELLQISVSTTDTDCENFAESFLSGKMDVNSFLNNFMEAKKLSALRKSKEERLTQQLNALERAGL